MGHFTLKPREFISAVILIFTINLSPAQVIEGIVLQDSTLAPLPFVNIGIVGFNKGVISKENGGFKINVSAELSNEVLRFSMIGYEPQDYKIFEIDAGRLKVLMTPRSYALKEVVITDYTKNKLKKYGNSKTSKVTTGHSGDGEYGIGFEWGLKIPKQEHSYVPKDINFNLRFNSVDSALFRIKIYSIKDELPQASLINNDLTVKSYKKQKWITTDVSYENLVIDDDIIITLQVLRVWNSRKGKKPFLYYPWQTIRKAR